jgi:hypothetical protein
MHKNIKSKFIGTLVIMLAAAGLLQANKSNPYSYFPQPPIRVDYIIKPDQAIYNRGDEIDYTILVTLDSLACNPLCEYRVYVGNLQNLLQDSELLDSQVSEYYKLDVHTLAAVITFKVKMLTRGTPPYIALKAVRIAQETATAKKQFLNIAIDQYAVFYVTSPEYQKLKDSGSPIIH